ncbi:hypothetical protein [Streptomyces sp. CB02261]|uniref:hypothetical protein n=1 Tax=Streptomyces sp. CB02261 TaxID=1703940 RepID=UPI00116125D3|nr:hypothetical protein [Streptomyces sp. CB02261]
MWGHAFQLRPHQPRNVDFIQRALSVLNRGDCDTARALLDLAHAHICLAEAEARAEEVESVAAEAAVEQQRALALKARADADQADADRAEAAARKAAAESAAAESQVATVHARAEVARAEVAALEAEDTARLTPVERAVRKVARLILAAHHTIPASRKPQAPDMYAVSLETVQDALRVSHTVAGQRRQAAADLIANGYTGDCDLSLSGQ